MIEVDATQARCLVFTYKDGLLAAVAHDLRLRVDGFTLEVAADGSSVRGRADAATLRVDATMRGGAEAAGALSARDYRKIEAAIRDDVLHARRHPAITFASDDVTAHGDGWRVRGALVLHGVSRPLVADVVRDGERLVAEVQIHQPDFGIRPYTAMLGTLRIQPRVTVRVEVPVLGG